MTQSLPEEVDDDVENGRLSLRNKIKLTCQNECHLTKNVLFYTYTKHPTLFAFTV